MRPRNFYKQMALPCLNYYCDQHCASQALPLFVSLIFDDADIGTVGSAALVFVTSGFGHFAEP